MKPTGKRRTAKKKSKKKPCPKTRPDVGAGLRFGLTACLIGGFCALTLWLVWQSAQGVGSIIAEPKSFPVAEVPVDLPTPPPLSENSTLAAIAPTEPVPEKRPATEILISLPKVAIIIDDIGYDMAIARKLVALNVPITLSVLPGSPHEQKIVRLIQGKPVELMMHLPMEPDNFPAVKPGPHALMSWMQAAEIEQNIELLLKKMPWIEGINNHMGSYYTQNPELMEPVLAVLKRHQLYFVDSRTTPATCGRQTAFKHRVPFAERDVFLDHQADETFVRHQFERLMDIAEDKQSAIGIGHPEAVTLKILTTMLPKIQNRVHLVPASAITHIIDP